MARLRAARQSEPVSIGETGGGRIPAHGRGTTRTRRRALGLDSHIKGLSKLVTRIKVDWQVRECVSIEQGEPTFA